MVWADLTCIFSLLRSTADSRNQIVYAQDCIHGSATLRQQVAGQRMEPPRLLLRILISFGLFSFVANQVCEDGGYVVINEPRRSTQNVHNDAVDSPLCDHDIDEGTWFRFNSYAGDAIVERAANDSVPTLHCGTEAPIYIRGLDSHPVTDNTTTTETVCANYAGNTCNWNATIQIHRCPGYYLYKLKSPPGCPLSYCVGENEICNLGDNWDGYSCVNYFPAMKGFPIFSGPHVAGSGLSEEIYFSCAVQYDRQPNDTNARFWVTFLFDGQKLEDVPGYTDKPPEHLGSTIITADGGLVVNLIEMYLRGRLGREISCMVESFWDGGPSNAVSSPMTSVATYRVAFESTVGSYSVNLTNGSTFDVTFDSTVPFTCRHCVDPGCCMYRFRMVQNASTIECALQWKGGYTATMTVYFVPYATQEGNSFAVAFQAYTDDTVSADGRSLWRDYVIPTVWMTIIPKPPATYKDCKSLGDPHISNFDGTPTLDNYGVGDFYLVKAINAKQHMEVQVRQEVCNGGKFTCNCGVVVREGNSAIKISICEIGSWSKSTQRYPTVVRLLSQDPADAAAVYMDGTGVKFSVRMPSGLRVEIDLTAPWFNVVVHLPPEYHGKTDSDSMCGNSNNNPADDSTTNLDRFRIPNTASYFRVQPACASIFNVAATRCGCNSTYVPKCSNTDPTLSDISTNDKPYSGRNTTGVVCPKSTKKKRRDALSQDDSSNGENDFIVDDLFTSVIDDLDIGVNVSFSWPTPKGKTQQEVEQYCMTTLQSSPVYASCSANADLATFIAMCASDVQIADDWIPVSAYTSVFEQSCLNNIAASISSSSDSSHDVLKSVSGQLCPNQCSGLGTCSEGTCICNTGYIGADCSIDQSLPPSLTGIIRRGVCDVRARPCDVISVFGSGVAFSSALKCRFTDQTTGDHVETTGTFITPVEYICPVPETTTHRRKRSVATGATALSTRKVSITGDGVLYSNALKLVLFDSVCMECNTSDTCRQKDSSCLIGGECFADGAVDPHDSCLQCVPVVSGNSLTNITVVEDWSPCSETCNGVKTRNVVCGSKITNEVESCQGLNSPCRASVLRFSSLSYLLLTLALATSLMSVVVYWQWFT